MAGSVGAHTDGLSAGSSCWKSFHSPDDHTERKQKISQQKEEPTHHKIWRKTKKGTWENRIIVLYIASSGAGALEPCGSSSLYLWQRLRSIRRPHTWRPEQVTVQRENRDDMLPLLQNVGTRWLTCVAFPHCDWAHVWRADSGCKSSCHSSHRRMVSEVRGGGTVVKRTDTISAVVCPLS